MSYLYRGLFGSVSLILAGIFHHIEVIYCLCLMVGGISFIPFPRNWQENLAAISLAMTGILIALDYSWAPVLFPVSGMLLFSGQPVHNVPISSRLKYAIGICLWYSALPAVLVLTGILSILMVMAFFIFEYANNELEYIIEYELE